MQQGVRNCILYENKGISYHYPQQLRHNLVDEVLTDGIIINVTQCNRIDFNFEIERGNNAKVKYNFNLRFFYAGISIQNIDYLQELNNPNGFIAQLEMQNGQQYIVPVPIKLEPLTAQNKNQGSFNVELKNRVQSFQGLFEKVEAFTSTNLLMTINLLASQSVSFTIGWTIGSLNVNWGDGTPTEPISNNIGKTHNYPSSGEYLVEVSGAVENINSIVAASMRMTEIYLPVINFTTASKNFDVSDNLLTSINFQNVNFNATGLNVYLQVNPNLNEILNFSNTGSISLFYAYSCNLTGTLDLSNCTVVSSLYVYLNANLTSILFPETDVNGARLHAYNCNLTGALDFSPFNIGDQCRIENNNLTDLINFSSNFTNVLNIKGNNFSAPIDMQSFNFRNCSLFVNNFINFYGFINLVGEFRAFYGYNSPNIGYVDFSNTSYEAGTVIRIYNSNQTSAWIDALFNVFDTLLTTYGFPPQEIRINGASDGIPTAASATARANLSAAGCLVLTN